MFSVSAARARTGLLSFLRPFNTRFRSSIFRPAAQHKTFLLPFSARKLSSSSSAAGTTTCGCGSGLCDGGDGRNAEMREGPGGVRYCGVFEGARMVKGRIFMPDGREYFGDFSKDTGHISDGGTLRFSDGAIYEGQFQNWSRQGKGTTTYPDGRKEEGTYQDNELVEGTVSIPPDEANPQGVTFMGTLKDGNFVEGLLKRDDMVYQGTFLDNLPHGEGKANLKNGMTYKGKFVKGVMEGKGELKTKGGAVYFGKFENGFLPEGSLILRNGSRYEGEFNEQGEMHGRGRFENEENRFIYTGMFRNNTFKDGQVLDQDGYPVELVLESFSSLMK